MLELESVSMSSASRLQQPQQFSGTASNSNSATSIQAALRSSGAAAAASGNLVTMDQRGGSTGDAQASISMGSGSGSIPYADDAMLGSGGGLSSPRPTSPETLNAQPPTASASTSTVKSLRSWFMPAANKQQQQQNASGAIVGNFGMPANSNSNSSNNNNYSNTNITTATSANSNTTNNTTTGTINITTNVTTKNSPNSELQDNSNQGSFYYFLCS